ncbi:MAG: divalent metal cation transporter [Candidatus Eremiobacteraeota bacterium]|nr:divalent metal cation transporter [Candidatus Eremiobacteraeota bacterium]MBV8365521.1 divalent metal cation transporter [Candidatus Eremiobacteraeota bacterium]
MVGVREAKLRRERTPIGRALALVGPGVITGASDDDPSGIATYAVAGATLGYAPLWTALVSFPMMAVTQFLCAKIGLVSGRGLGELLRMRYPRAVVVVLTSALLIANTINAGTDIGAIAASLNLLVPVPIVAMVVPVGAAVLALQIWASYRVVATVFKWLSLALFAYVASAFFARPDWHAVLRGTFVPSFSLHVGFITTFVAILGTTISPYMFFWQARQEVEEDIEFGRTTLRERKGATDAEMRYTAWDVNAGMLFSQIVMYFIILSAAATLHKSGHFQVHTAADVARALEPLAGKGAALLMALGMIGAGVLAVPILTSSSAFALAGTFGWKAGLSKKPARAPQFYSAIALSTCAGVIINFAGISPIDALFWTAVINGVLAPILLVFVMLLSNDRKLMGKRTNSPLVGFIGWTTTAVMAAAAIAMFAFWGRS